MKKKEASQPAGHQSVLRRTGYNIQPVYW